MALVLPGWGSAISTQSRGCGGGAEGPEGPECRWVGVLEGWWGKPVRTECMAEGGGVPRTNFQGPGGWGVKNQRDGGPQRGALGQGTWGASGVGEGQALVEHCWGAVPHSPRSPRGDAGRWELGDEQALNCGQAWVGMALG